MTFVLSPILLRALEGSCGGSLIKTVMPRVLRGSCWQEQRKAIAVTMRGHHIFLQANQWKNNMNNTHIKIALVARPGSDLDIF